MILRTVAIILTILGMIVLSGCSTEESTTITPTTPQELDLGFGSTLNITPPPGWRAHPITDSLAQGGRTAVFITDQQYEDNITSRRISSFANLDKPDSISWNPSWELSGIMIAGTPCKGLPSINELKSDSQWRQIEKFWTNIPEESEHGMTKKYFSSSQYALRVSGTGQQCKAVIAQSMNVSPDKSHVTGLPNEVMESLLRGEIGEVTM